MSLTMSSLFDLDRSERARSDDEYRRADDRARRDALAAYQQRFKLRMLAVLSKYGGHMRNGAERSGSLASSATGLSSMR